MRELTRGDLPRRIVGRDVLTTRLVRLQLAVHRYAKHRARTHDEVAWCSRVMVALETALEVTKR